MKTFTFILLFCISAPATLFSQTIQDALGDADTVKALQFIREGQDVNALNERGISLLMNAARWGDSLAVTFLLSHGATVDTPRTLAGRTPLLIASSYYSGMNVISMLVNAGADVNHAENNGQTALMLAAFLGKIEIVNYLLSKGANPNLKDAAGKSALDYAREAEIDEMLIKMLKGIAVDKEATIATLEKAMK